MRPVRGDNPAKLAPLSLCSALDCHDSIAAMQFIGYITHGNAAGLDIARVAIMGRTAVCKRLSACIGDKAAAMALNAYEALLAQAREERAIMLKEARDTKDKIINEAREQAKIAADKILTDAQAMIEQRRMAALIDVKNEIGMIVVEISEKILRRQLDNLPDQERYIKQLAEEVKLN